MSDLIPVNESGKPTARELYEFLSPNDKSNYSRWAKTNIEQNEFYSEGIDYWGFVIVTSGNGTKDYRLTIDFAKHLCMLSRSDRGKQARNYFIEVEKRYIANTPIPQMTQTQIIAAIAQAAADQEKQLQQIAATQVQQAEQLQGMRDVISLDTTSWRADTKNLLNKIAHKIGDITQVRELRSESYKLLDMRMGVSLQTRLTNKRRRMADEGICKSARDKLNFIDVIAEDKKLIEGYTAIIKEMAIKYGA